MDSSIVLIPEQASIAQWEEARARGPRSGPHTSGHRRLPRHPAAVNFQSGTRQPARGAWGSQTAPRCPSSHRFTGHRQLQAPARASIADSVCASVQWAEGTPCPSSFSKGKADGVGRRPTTLAKSPTLQATSHISRPWIKGQVLEPGNNNSGPSDTYTYTFHVLFSSGLTTP